MKSTTVQGPAAHNHEEAAPFLSLRSVVAGVVLGLCSGNRREKREGVMLVGDDKGCAAARPPGGLVVPKKLR
ncbi:hypothetical protein HanRHA438_Chr00c03g0844571 [Helianthus annuus]|uniref:Uncharacterized protein n=1 Tax=Helianthus annuus TaxID=4232 RepID=A0A9K3NUT3_HELAN|nr:hypothetical protein HanXRQr2_Chr03g0106731 [Helianthus annuus]KAJ0600424.1 hypothetical protein HanIR_Chr03g0116461 [Helianthus annuus]KAJ0773615.1 hypothetical protein HanOQP8_Chr03g0101311 [Helianthus annuus]KAJ0955007.1 hypothetical protein HanRHA438_Chr00c03g0844571 [Helianthus annuus]